MNTNTIFRQVGQAASLSFAPRQRIAQLGALAAVAVALAVTNSAAESGGTVNFGNHSSSRVINGQTSLPVQAGDNVRAALYWSPSASSTFVQLGAAVPVGTPLPGLFVGGTRTNGPATPGGTSAKFQVRAWSGGYTTYEAALPHAGILIGQSAVIINPTGDPWGSPPAPPVSLLVGGLASFTLTTNAGPAQPPTLTCASNKTVQCGSAWAFDAPTAMDGCTTNRLPVYVLSTATNGLCPQLITRTWAATNSCDTNYTTCSQLVTVVDTTPPVLICASNKTVQCGAAWAFDPPTVTDACSGSNVTLSVVSTITNGVCPQVITRTWTATDLCGNSNVCAQVVTVVDTTPPVLICASDKTVQCGSGWSFDVPTVTDACSGSNVTLSIVSTVTNGACSQTITRTWLAADLCGNSTICSQVVSVVATGLPVFLCSTNKTVICDTNWAFDLPQASDPCSGATLPVSILGTVSNSLGSCIQLLTRTWVTTNACNTNVATCSQTVTVTCSNCPVIAVTKQCPPWPVPPGGTLAFTGTVTNTGNVALTNVLVVNDQPAPNTVVFGPGALEPGAGAQFGASYRVPPCNCGPFVDTLTASGVSPYGAVVTSTFTTTCPGTNVYSLAGDLNGDGIVDQDELNAVLANYWASSPWLYMTNPASLGGGFFQFALTNATGWNFTVITSSNLVDWTTLPEPAYPVYQFYDPEAASNAPMHVYRLRYP
jgi:uncharacterized repeat protein (TIGR01451 family)